MINKLVKNRSSILFIELAGLLHDIGKLSSAFLDYRRTWQSDPHGYDKDPHDHCYLTRQEPYQDLLPDQFATMLSDLGGCNFEEPNFSIRRAVCYHTEPEDAPIGQMLKAADAIDSAFDRNNPLWSAEQKDKIYQSNVFGHESRLIDPAGQDEIRRQLYIRLRNELSGYFKSFSDNQRWAVYKCIEEAFQKAVSDTTRPQNDTTLWEHSYAVASILKATAAHHILTGDERMDSFEKVRFEILGIGWDGMAYISPGQRIGDIVGRKRIIDLVEKDLKSLIEWELPLGNEIYRDDDGIYFVVPDGLTKLGQAWEEIYDKIYAISANTSLGDLQPHIVNVPRTNSLTALVVAIEKMKEKTAFRFDSSAPGFGCFFGKTGNSLVNGKTICPICKLRSVEHDDAKRKVCEVCKDRRRTPAADAADGCANTPEQTVFTTEIADGTGKAAMIVARFGLKEWLNGTMIRTLFVTQAEGIKKEIIDLPFTEQFKAEEADFKRFFASVDYGEFDYRRIKADIDAVCCGGDEKRAEHVAFLYDRRVEPDPMHPADYSLKRDPSKTRDRWCQVHRSAQKEHPGIDVYNVLTAKTPTPSTILNVWETTKRFFENVAERIAKEVLPAANRLRLAADTRLLPVERKGSFEARVVFADGSQRAIEVLVTGESAIEVIGEAYPSPQNWQGAIVRITDPEYPALSPSDLTISYQMAGTFFVPCRTVTISPNLFIGIVPARQAVPISIDIYKEYIRQFGKVTGRLPFSLGNIFFRENLPMFVVLDGARRMIANFDELALPQSRERITACEYADPLAEGKRTIRLVSDLRGLPRHLTWSVPCCLGDDKTEDFYHPYVVIEDTKGGLEAERKSFFKTTAGSVVHVSEIKPGDRLCLCPNYYDFEFLDSNARRYDLQLRNGARRSSVADFPSKPVFLEELENKVYFLWDKLFKDQQLPGITDTKLRNLQSLWLTKLQEWRVDLARTKTDAYQNWMRLVHASIGREFHEMKDEHFDMLDEMIRNGLFFDTLEIYLAILKERIGKSQ